MAVLNLQVSAGTSDGYSQGAVFHNTETYILVGAIGVTVTDAFALFYDTDISLLNGATINSAALDVYVGTVDAAALTKAFFERANNPAAPSDATDHGSRTRTTSGTDYDSYSSTGWLSDTTGTINMKAPLEEVIANHTLVDTLLVLLDDDGSPANGYPFLRSYEYTGNAHGFKLTIDYTPSSGYGGEFCGVAVDEVTGVAVAEIDGV